MGACAHSLLLVIQTGRQQFVQIIRHVVVVEHGPELRLHQLILPGDELAPVHKGIGKARRDLWIDRIQL